MELGQQCLKLPRDLFNSDPQDAVRVRLLAVLGAGRRRRRRLHNPAGHAPRTEQPRGLRPEWITIRWMAGNLQDGQASGGGEVHGSGIAADVKSAQ
jgi:hypothetical protein